MKKLKGLSRDAFNRLYHVHTVTGIVISFALYVIFFAGAFSLFYDEMAPWENPEYRMEFEKDFDFDHHVGELSTQYDIDFEKEVWLYLPTDVIPKFSVGFYEKVQDSTEKADWKEVNLNSQGEYVLKKESKTTVANTLYKLHYFGQIKTFGILLAGFVSLFFLFSVVTGVIVHWANLFTKFYAFIKEGKWKLIWTNAHTVFGLIGLPFQLIFAITGVALCLLPLAILPAALLIDEETLNEAAAKVEPWYYAELENTPSTQNNLPISKLRNITQAEYPNHTFGSATLQNYGQENAQIVFHAEDTEGMLGRGHIVRYMKDGRIHDDLSTLPYDKDYFKGVYEYLHVIHFGQFGGLGLKILYFVMSMITCFMIMAGVMLWRTARDIKKYTLKQRVFHHQVTKIYLAISLSLFPAVALLFAANKLVPMGMESRISYVNAIFFLGWLALTIVGVFWDKYSQQNRNYAIIGGILSLSVPILNGLVTGGWFWNTFNSFRWVAAVDLFWLFTGLVSLYLSFFVLKVKATSDKPSEPKMEKAYQL
ncbi:MAG: PepSY-associated TM helix domain-containing protein [Bacteroidota bacterium]